MSYIWTYYLFNRLNKLSHRTNLLLIPQRVQEKMTVGNKQHRWNICRLPDADTTQDWRRSDKRIYNWDTSADKWKCGVRGIGPWRRPARTPCAYNYHRGLHGTYGLQFCATAQPQRLNLKDGDRPREIAWNQKVPKQINPYSEDAPLWMEQLKTSFSRRCKQSSCNHWCTSWRGFYRRPH